MAESLALFQQLLGRQETCPDAVDDRVTVGLLPCFCCSAEEMWRAEGEKHNLRAENGHVH